VQQLQVSSAIFDYQVHKIMLNSFKIVNVVYVFVCRVIVLSDQYRLSLPVVNRASRK
jgi:hypothetical protein